MIFKTDNLLVRPAEYGFDVDSISDKMHEMDFGFYLDESASKPVLIDRKRPVISYGDKTKPESYGLMSCGLTSLIGPPGSGKTTFVKETLVDKLGFLYCPWGEPDSGSENQVLSKLLYYLELAVQTKVGGVVIDSLMALIISMSENLGAGGLSKRLLSYFRQLANLAYDSGVHLVVVTNPLEGGEVHMKWADYVKGVCHATIYMESYEPYLSVRSDDPKGFNVGTYQRGFIKQDGTRFAIAYSTALQGAVWEQVRANLDTKVSAYIPSGERLVASTQPLPEFGSLPRRFGKIES